MSGTEGYHFTPNKRARVYGRWEGQKYYPDDVSPVVVKCANCFNYVRNIVQVISVMKLKEGHPQIAQNGGKDKIYRTENWCLRCVVTGTEEDSNRTIMGVGYGSS